MKFAELETSTQVIIKIILAVLGLAFLWLIRDIVVIFLLAVIFASAMEPLVDYLHYRKIPRGATVAAVYLIVIGLVVLVVSLLIPPATLELRNVLENLPTFISALQERFPFVAEFIARSNINVTALVGSVLSSDTQQGLYNQTADVVRDIVAFLTVLVISFYLVVDEKGMKQAIASFVPPDRQDFAINLVTKIQNKMGLWVLGQLILSVTIFVVTFIGLSILGVKYALFLALLAGILEVVPYIGPTLSAIPALFFALLQSPALAVGVLVLYLLIQKAENYILVPKVMQRTVGTSPLVVLLALLVGFKLAGLFGLLLAVPIASAVTVIIAEFSSQKIERVGTVAGKE
jgi:predicted PurR-regulated permease PerM